MLFAFAISVVTGVLAGVLPAIRAGRTDLNDALKEGGRSDAGSVGLRTRRLLIVCEVALSVVLLMGAGVMIRSLLALRSVDAGFDPRNVLTLQVALPGDPLQDTGADDGVLRWRAAAPADASGRAGGRQHRRSAAGRRLAAADRRGRQSRAPAKGSADRRRAQDHAGLSPRDARAAVDGSRLRGRRRPRDAGQPRGGEAALGRRRPGRSSGAAPARVEDDRVDGGRHRRRHPRSGALGKSGRDGVRVHARAGSEPARAGPAHVRAAAVAGAGGHRGRPCDRSRAAGRRMCGRWRMCATRR